MKVVYDLTYICVELYATYIGYNFKTYIINILVLVCVVFELPGPNFIIKDLLSV